MNLFFKSSVEHLNRCGDAAVVMQPRVVMDRPLLAEVTVVGKQENPALTVW